MTTTPDTPKVRAARPKSVTIALALMCLGAALCIANALTSFALGPDDLAAQLAKIGRTASPEQLASAVTARRIQAIVVGVVLAAAWLIVASLVARGSRGAYLVGMGLGLFYLLQLGWVLAALIGAGSPALVTLLPVLALLATVLATFVAFLTPSMRRWIAALPTSDAPESRS